MFKIFKTRTRTIKFEKIKVDETLTTYKALSDSTIQHIIAKYCIENDLMLKSIYINYTDCRVQIIGTKEDVYKLVMYLLYNYNECLKNFTY